jgi:pimeloyl-ACP methyl ester carboxylesterase
MSSSSCIFVPGAWHSADGFDRVIELLAAKVLTSWKVDLPSVGRSPPIPSLGPDIKAIHNAILAELQQGHEVTVVCHSYGGFPTSQALRGLEKPQSMGG